MAWASTRRAGPARSGCRAPWAVPTPPSSTSCARRCSVVESLLAWVAGLPGAAVYAVLVVLSAVENVFPPVPADVAVVLGAFLSRQGLVSAPLLGVLCWMANTASSAGMYFYARAHGRRWLASGWRSRLVPSRSLAALEDAYARHGVYGIFLSRFLPGIRAAVTPVAGVAGLSPARALVPPAGPSATR